MTHETPIDLSAMLLGWLRDAPGSWLEEEQGQQRRLLRHRAADGSSLNDCALTVDIISRLIELNWEGRLDRRPKDDAPSLHIYTLSTKA